MASLQQAFWEMDVYGFTLLEEVLSAAEVEALRSSLAEWAARLGDEQRFLGQAGHVSNLPTLGLALSPARRSPPHAAGHRICAGQTDHPWQPERAHRPPR